ncbi:MAG TPA: SBBP repeat-containing protein, partial [Candidatus Acidoferrum sp.]|nr:SBBP repeat-containing protein [Candidatus Acidoferrum sp.]
PQATVAGLDPLPTRVNYFIGNEPKKWHTDISTYSHVKYQDVYPGVDLLFYGNQRRLEYDFAVAPGADAKAIALNVQGASKLRIDQHGNLLMKVPGGEVEWQKPDVYQDVKGERHQIAGSYAITNGNEIRFSLPNYDHSLPLTIDPALNYVTYLGGSGSDVAFGIALDSAGDAYVAGETTSTDFPPGTLTPPLDTATVGTAFVSELNPAGTQLLFSTYLGGSGETGTGDAALAIAVDGSGAVYVTGFTGSSDFPTTAANALIPTAPGNSSGFGTGFITKLIPANPAATQLAYSSYLGGSNEDQGNGIAVDANGNAYVTGVTLSTDFPTTPNAISTTLLNPNGSAFLSEINTNASGTASKVYSTYFGGTNGAGTPNLFGDAAFGVTIDTGSNAYIVGTTTSTDFPPIGHVVSSCLTDANGIAFVSVINTATPAMTYSTCLGGASTETQGFGITLGLSSIVYVTGQTTSADFPVTVGSIPAPAGGVTAGVVFVSLLNTTSATPNQYSTYLGGSNGDLGNGIATDSTGDAYVTGGTNSADFPITQGAILVTRKNANGTGFVSKINPGGHGLADLLYSSYFGGSGNGSINDVGNGIAVSAADNAYITGQTSSSDLPVTSGVFQSALKSTTTNAFVADLPLTPTISYSPTSIDFGTQLVSISSLPQFVTITNNTASAVTLTLPPTTTGANPADFVGAAGGTSPCTTSLAAGASCTIGVTFTPSNPVAETATLNIVDSLDTSSHPMLVALSGTGSATTSNITITPTSLTLPGALLTTSTNATVSIGNNG